MQAAERGYGACNGDPASSSADHPGSADLEQIIRQGSLLKNQHLQVVTALASSNDSLVTEMKRLFGNESRDRAGSQADSQALQDRHEEGTNLLRNNRQQMAEVWKTRYRTRNSVWQSRHTIELRTLIGSMSLKNNYRS